MRMMRLSFQGKNNAADIKKIEAQGGKVTTAEIFKGASDGHKFLPGDMGELHGLEDYPEFNGEVVKITSIREDGPHGKAYYFETSNEELASQLNWTYEYRLK